MADTKKDTTTEAPKKLYGPDGETPWDQWVANVRAAGHQLTADSKPIEK